MGTCIHPHTRRSLPSSCCTWHRFGNVETLGLNQKERVFLSKIPLKIKDLLKIELLKNFPNIEKGRIKNEVEIAVCDTRYSPAINLNSLFNSSAKCRKHMLGQMQETHAWPTVGNIWIDPK